MCTVGESQVCGASAGEVTHVLAVDQEKGGGQWALRNVAFTCHGAVGKLVCDTGADKTVVSEDYCKKAKMEVTKMGAKEVDMYVTAADGQRMPVVGRANMDVTIQVVLDDDGVLVHWDRVVTLRGVLVVKMGSAPRDLYVAWADWRPSREAKENSPLAALAALVMSGATVYDTPRIPDKEDVMWPDQVVVAAVSTAKEEDKGPAVAAPKPRTTEELAAFRVECWERIDKKYKDDPAAKRLVDELVKRERLFGPHDPKELTETVEFTLKEGAVPKKVSFKVPIRRGGAGEAATRGLREWEAAGVCKKVPWDVPAHGFVIIVPKADGKFRVTVSPKAVNEATEVYDPPGGYMPDSMSAAAQRVGAREVAFKLDFKEAFTTLKLGPKAQELSTFTTPLGKYRFERGWFGWHSFPGIWQTTVMEKIVLPTLDEFKNDRVDLENWVDDVLGGAMDVSTAVDLLLTVLDKIGAIGGRLSLKKCTFLTDRFTYCGLEVDMKTHSWRVEGSRVESLAALPQPKDREALQHMLGVLRYYYFVTHDLPKQRERIAVLSELDELGIKMADKWSEKHTKAMADAIGAVMKGDWAMCFDPSRPVYVTTDASGLHGYCVTANQWDAKTGKMRPVAFYSHGWIATQLKWTPQVKECYAARQAVCVYMPRHFPYAKVILLCDNKNLMSDVDSEDLRVTRWLHDMRSTGCVTQYWLKGSFNTIADYGSRAVVAAPDGALSKEDAFQGYIYGLTSEPAPPEDTTTVPGHIHAAPLVKRIMAAQNRASTTEKATWTGKKYSTVIVAGQKLVLHNGRMVVPNGEDDIKKTCLGMAHDDTMHYTGGDRTLWALQQRAKVVWHSMRHDVALYVASCHRCQMVKTPHGKPDDTHLHPTLAPHVHHTWYLDFKGPFPGNSGYVLMCVEAVSRSVKIRYVPKADAKELIEELEEIKLSYGTTPLVMRTDGGQPFDSAAYKEWCAANGIVPIKGLPYHSRGQGLVENKFKGLADAIMATLGAKAPTSWFKGSLLMDLEYVINATMVGSIGGSPTWVLTGREPRTPLSAATDWTDKDFAKNVFSGSAISFEDFNNMVASHHENILKIQDRAGVTSTLAQAITKKVFDKKHNERKFETGEWVLVHRTAPNRMEAHFTGPYKIKKVTGNEVQLSHYLSMDVTEGPVHASRLLSFDMSRATPQELAQFQLGEGNDIVSGVQDHRELADGSYEYMIKWLSYPVPTWVDGERLSKVVKVIQYSEVHGLPKPGKAAPEVKTTKGQETKANTPRSASTRSRSR